MFENNSHLTDEKIICQLSVNNTNAWEYVYNRYLLMMYGEILKMTDDKTITESFLIKAFIQFKENKIFLEDSSPFFINLFNYTKTAAIEYFILKGITLKNDITITSNFPLTDLILFKLSSGKIIRELIEIEKRRIPKTFYEQVKNLKSKLKLKIA